MQGLRANERDQTEKEVPEQVSRTSRGIASDIAARSSARRASSSASSNGGRRRCEGGEDDVCVAALIATVEVD